MEVFDDFSMIISICSLWPALPSAWVWASVSIKALNVMGKVLSGKLSCTRTDHAFI